MKIYTFQEWRERAIEDTAPDDLVFCPNCDGEGVAECDCCGHETECSECDCGQVRFETLSNSERKNYFNQARYTEALTKDLTDLANWTGADRIATFVENGLSVYSTIPNPKYESTGREVVRLAK